MVWWYENPDDGGQDRYQEGPSPHRQRRPEDYIPIPHTRLRYCVRYHGLVDSSGAGARICGVVSGIADGVGHAPSPEPTHSIAVLNDVRRCGDRGFRHHEPIFVEGEWRLGVLVVRYGAYVLGSNVGDVAASIYGG